MVNALFNTLVSKDASLIEINPLVITKKKKLICLDAKMNFDNNAMYRRPEILKLRDLNEEEPAEIEASKFGLAYIKLNGSIGCMVKWSWPRNVNYGYNKIIWRRNPQIFLM